MRRSARRGDDRWAAAGSGRLAQMRLDVLGSRIGAELVLGHQQDLVDQLQGLVDQRPIASLSFACRFRVLDGAVR